MHYASAAATAIQAGDSILALSDQGAGVPLRELALVGLTAAVITYLATGWVRVLAMRWGAVAYPRERDVHLQPTPRMGGLAMYLGVVAAVLLASQLPALTRGFVYSSGMPAVVVAGGLIMVVGLIDDRWGLDALTKFAGQITAASVMVTMGVSWSVLYIPIGGVGTIVLDQVASIVLTLALTVAIVNAMNFVDGLDGLAAGLGLITASAICIFSIGLLRDHGGDVLFYPPAVISVVLAGICLGFLPHNFYRARIFMGDSGSMLIGLMLAAASTTAAGPISQTAYGVRDVFALLSPFLLVIAVMFVPALDMLLAIIRRTRAGLSPFSPDKMHLHHRLLEIGHSHRRVVLLIYLWVGIVAFGAASTIFFDPKDTAAVMAGAIVVAVIVTAIPLLRGRETPADGVYDKK
ncbi:undecaprenyl/decaprenyl-phosphate alpha-N-acetylglucosaminyl 1-phosphate transferase [Mycobacterium sp. Y57]|uniref:glycosyltransferase family 4 protein n=1 Tax=Mycolicibacterium xanthum TaxID=2796469 RepID=UPI001C84BE3B|nr:MraY family glycosyltransferase [Mycolicibacterium xanthum]MBX7433563.1 undecaprenyl/decaprenyl-phosphate alpha-N-acetylglucosaminyl 1-phosphate transferase [Mycolicibacterium xanthum]